MKHILKGQEPDALRMHREMANEDWRPTYGNLRTEDKADLLNTLLAEQGYLCCYCQRRVDAGNSHIEHLRPQSRFPMYSLEYGNLLCSCVRATAKGEPLHCGVAKDEWFDPNMVVPLDEDCERRFRFFGNGQVVPREPADRPAEQTINKLRLNIPKLRSLRVATIDALLDLNQNDIRTLLESEQEGRLHEFYTVIEQVLLRER